MILMMAMTLMMMMMMMMYLKYTDNTDYFSWMEFERTNKYLTALSGKSKSKACEFRMHWQFSNFSIAVDGKNMGIKHLARTGLL
jgi:hypothetical protein